MENLHLWIEVCQVLIIWLSRSPTADSALVFRNCRLLNAQAKLVPADLLAELIQAQSLKSLTEDFVE